MDALRILVLCLSAALICASLRATHPQIATAAALAAGVAALMLSVNDLGSLSETIRSLEAVTEAENMDLLKMCALAMLAEFASDICRDAGETALSRRIDTGVKIGLVASALPAAVKIMEEIAGLAA